LDEECDFPTLQSSTSRKSSNDIQNARSRFHKSLSTNTLLDQNGKGPLKASTSLLEKAALGEGKLLVVNPADIEDKRKTDVVHTDIVSTETQTPTVSVTTPTEPKPLHKVPSFSEKVVETLSANIPTGKAEGNQASKEGDIEHLGLVPSKPPRPLLKSRSDHRNLLEFVRKPPLGKSAPPKPTSEGGPTKTPETVPVKPLEPTVRKPRQPPSPLVYRKVRSEPGLLHLWKKDGAITRTESTDSAGVKKDTPLKNSRAGDKALELIQQKRNSFLEELRKKEAIKNGELPADDPEGDKSPVGPSTDNTEDAGKERDCTVEQFAEAAVVNFMKQLGWTEDGDDHAEGEGLTEEELSGVAPLDSAQMTLERERRNKQLAQTLRQWHPSPAVASAKSLDESCHGCLALGCPNGDVDHAQTARN